MSVPVDIERLEAFCDGTAEGLRVVVEIFLSDTLETLTELDRAVARADQAEILLLAHRAAGSCGACGASTLASLLGQLESLAASPATADESRLAEAISTEFQVVTRFLRSHVEGRAT